MQWTEFVAATVSILILAACFWLLPAISHPAVPLGVSVPAEHAGHPAVAVSVNGYRRKVALAGLLAVVVAAALARVWPAGAAVAPTLLMTVLGALSAITSRRHLIAAKTSAKWVQGTPSPRPLRAGVPWSWYIASLGVLLAAAGYGVYKYPTLPATIATHFGANGAANSLSTKSVLSVFGPLFIAAGVLLVLAVAAVQLSRTPAQAGVPAGQDPDRAAVARMNATGTFLAVTALTVSIMVSVLAVTGWLDVTGSFPVALPVLFIVVGLGLGGLVSWHRYRLESAGPAVVEGPPAAGSPADPDRRRTSHPDDESLWLAGFIYNNPDDKRVFVPKRTGLGLTVNWGTGGGKLFYGVVVLLVVAGPLASILSK